MTARGSRQRDLIYKILKGTTSHPDADWIYGEVRKEIPNISLGTVYRNLAKMVEEKEIIKIETNSGTIHYDARVENHYHIICNACGRIDDIFLNDFDIIDKAADAAYSGCVKGHRLIFFGLCAECAKTKEKNY